MVGDVNVIDFDNLGLHRPEKVADLPGGASRLRQRADGYLQTIKSGAVTFENGEHTGALPGALLRAADERRPHQGRRGLLGRVVDRDRPRIRSFFGPIDDYDVPTGPSTAGKGPDSIEARLRLGLEGLAGYDHGPAAVVRRAPWWSPSTPSTGAGPAASRSRCRSSRSSTCTTASSRCGATNLDLQTLMTAFPASWQDRLATADLSWIHDATEEMRGIPGG